MYDLEQLLNPLPFITKVRKYLLSLVSYLRRDWDFKKITRKPSDIKRYVFLFIFLLRHLFRLPCPWDPAEISEAVT